MRQKERLWEAKRDEDSKTVQKFYCHEELRESWKERRYREVRIDGWRKEREDVLGLKMVPVGSRWKRELICLHGPAFLSAR